jgi:hypothetical protein
VCFPKYYNANVSFTADDAMGISLNKSHLSGLCPAMKRLISFGFFRSYDMVPTQIPFEVTDWHICTGGITIFTKNKIPDIFTEEGS